LEAVDDFEEIFLADNKATDDSEEKEIIVEEKETDASVIVELDVAPSIIEVKEAFPIVTPATFTVEPVVDVKYEIEEAKKKHKGIVY
jgi:hypothetical protein